ncbi:MAG: hypothetical protein V3R93_02035 [Candidatus Hydrothermarchaeaceae archaeon]
MKLKLFLVVLVLSAFASGCVSKPQDDSSATTTTLAAAEEAGGDIPDVAEVPEDELIEEPDLEINETVDLGSLL